MGGLNTQFVFSVEGVKPRSLQSKLNMILKSREVSVQEL